MVRGMLAAAIALLLTGGCSNEVEGVAPAAAETVTRATEIAGAAVPAGEIKLPDRWGLPGVMHVKAAQSWNDRLSTLSGLDRSKLESLNARYHGMLEFDSAEEQAKLIADGVPMPEEWLAAEKMSDEALARLASANSPKGSMFFANRQLDRYIDAMQRLEGSGIDRDFDTSVINSRTQAMVYASNALALTRSPFAAYLYGSVFARIHGRPEYMAAAIAVADALGDERAQELASAYDQRVEWATSPPLRLGSLVAIESTMWFEVHRYRPL